MKWICLHHGKVSCPCGSRDVAPWGNGEFAKWCRPRRTDIYRDPKPEKFSARGEVLPVEDED